MKKKYQSTKEATEAQREHSRRRNREIRLIVLRHYSSYNPFCACCGEKEINFLTLEHMEGGGNKHRQLIYPNGKGRSGPISGWIIKNNFPAGFQVLCYNCNCAKGHYGICPHRVKKEEILD